MSDNALPPQSKPANDSASKAPLLSKRAGSQSNTLQKITSVACLVLAMLLFAQWWTSRNETSQLRAEIARRLQLGDSTNKETKNLASLAQEGMKALQAKVESLEAKQAEALAEQMALSQIYQNISQNRDDWALSEVESVLSTASQQLQLSANVQGALIALQNAEKNLARMEKLQFAPILRAIKKDIKRLQSLPDMDLTGVAIHLDEIIGQIDWLPLLADKKSVLPKKSTPQTPKKTVLKDREGGVQAAVTADEPWWQLFLRPLKSWSSDIFSELYQLVRIREVGEQDALLVSPDQSYFIRENLKLRLLSVRLALLSRNEVIFSSDIVTAQEAIKKYFDTFNKQTQMVQEALKQVKASKLRIQMPALESLNAVYKFKSKN